MAHLYGIDFLEMYNIMNSMYCQIFLYINKCIIKSIFEKIDEKRDWKMNKNPIDSAW